MYTTHGRLLWRLAKAGAGTFALAGAGAVALAGIYAERHRVPGQP